MIYNAWRNSHLALINNFMEHLTMYGAENFVLKGGTVLMLCYGLDCFSEDVDLDGFGGDIHSLVVSFVQRAGVTYRVAKNTQLVKRFLLHYDNPFYSQGDKPLKVEVSFRSMRVPAEHGLCVINGILTYSPQRLLLMKISAYMGRDKLRDLYDIVFLGLNYWDSFDDSTRFSLQNTLAMRGFEHFDYLTQTQQDDLIDKHRLANDFLRLWAQLNLNLINTIE